MKNLNYLIAVFIFMSGLSGRAEGPISSGGADSYVTFDCESTDKKIKLAGYVGTSCLQEIKISGEINKTIEQECLSKDTKFIYTEDFRKSGRLVISGSQGSDIFHITSQKAISIKSRGKWYRHEDVVFDGEFIYDTWINAKKVTTFKQIRCESEIFLE